MATRFITKLLIALGIILAAFFLYRYLFVSSDKATETPGLQAAGGPGGGPGSPAADDEFIRLLDRLQGVKLNSDLFASPAWKSLINFQVALEPEPKSRKNPFAPIGFDVLPSGTTTATSTRRSR